MRCQIGRLVDVAHIYSYYRRVSVMVEAQSGEKDKVEVEQKDNKCSTKG